MILLSEYMAYILLINHSFICQVSIHFKKWWLGSRKSKKHLEVLGSIYCNTSIFLTMRWLLVCSILTTCLMREWKAPAENRSDGRIWEKASLQNVRFYWIYYQKVPYWTFFFEHINEMALGPSCYNLVQASPLVFIPVKLCKPFFFIFLRSKHSHFEFIQKIQRNSDIRNFEFDKKEFPTGVRLKSQNTRSPLCQSTPTPPLSFYQWWFLYGFIK